jgi:hypothetical protein
VGLFAAVGAGPERSETFRSLLSERALVVSLRLRIALGIGIVGLMTMKPDAVVSGVVLAASAAAGLAAGLVPRTARGRESSEA